MNRSAIKITLIALTAALFLSLTACGKEKEPEEETWEYAATFKEKTILTGNGYISARAATDDSIYLLESIYDEKNASTLYKLHTLNTDTLDETVTDLSPEITEGGASIGKILPGKDGTICFITEAQNAETGDFKTCLVESKDGNAVSKLDLSFLSEDGAYLSSEAFTRKGDLFYASLDGTIKAFDRDGKIRSSETAGFYVSLMVSNSNGDLVCIYYNDNGANLGSIDAGGKLAKTLAAGNVNGTIYAGKDGKVFATGDSSAKEYDLNTGESKLLWNWLNADIYDSGVFYIGNLENGDYRVISQDQSDDGRFIVSVADLTYRKATADKEKETVIFGCLAVEDHIKENIRKFNKHSDKYRIKVKSYMDLYDDITKAEEMLKADIVAGKQLDLFMLAGYEYVNYKNARALKDIKPFFDKDLNRSDYFENILDIYSSDGKQYAIPVSFSLDTVIVSEDTAAGRTSWSQEDILSLRKQNPNCTFLDEGSRDSAFFMMLNYTLGDFVDYEKADCKFDSDEFKQLLEFAMTFPEEIDYMTYDGWSSIKTGDSLMTMASLWSPELIELYNILFDNKASLIGFPSSDGSGNRIRASAVYAISAKSKHADGAWAFIKTFLEPEFQKNQPSFFPMLKSVYNENVAEYREGKIQKTYNNGRTAVELNGITQEEENKLLSAIESATAGVFYDTNITDIIREESQGYFKGQKTADEVAKIVQSRVKIYLQEKQ